MSWRTSLRRKSATVRDQGELAHARREVQAYATILAWLVHERGGSLFISEKDMESLPPCKLHKRNDTVLDGWQFDLEYGPAKVEAVDDSLDKPEK